MPRCHHALGCPVNGLCEMCPPSSSEAAADDGNVLTAMCFWPCLPRIKGNGSSTALQLKTAVLRNSTARIALHVFPAHPAHIVTYSQNNMLRISHMTGMSAKHACVTVSWSPRDSSLLFQWLASWVSAPFSRRNNIVRQAAHASGDRSL